MENKMLQVVFYQKKISTNVRLQESKMRHMESILKEYKQADANKRLDMFMAYRELREEFRSIDHEEEPIIVLKTKRQ